MNLVDNLKQTYRQGNAVIRLIYINVAVYLSLQIFLIVMKLFTLNGDFALSWLALPSDINGLLYRPWTFVTYMFLHQEFFHILFNMLALYWFGKLFLTYFTGKQLFGLYFFGGLVAGLFYIVAYNVFPLFSEMSGISILMGASGSIMAIIVATAFQSPNLEMRFLLIGAVKLKYIAIVAVLISFFGITSSNAGGELAHLGGALYGYFFVVSLRRGKDHTRNFNRLMDTLSNLFKPRKLKVKRAVNSGQKMSDAEFNMQKASKMAEIDRILDKIKTSGYGSLTSEEKKKLFE
ncbi:MAG: rhomboid family intramembrane serine protease [Paludibacter sp.]|nr:rhomboid family intramembrane serine protease [Paludibacter sp.]